MTCVIRAVAFANGVPCPHAGQWLQSCDHDAHGGRGYAEFTEEIADAMRFASVAEAIEFWNRQSTVMSLRPDGKPNRPLTALTAVIEPIS